MNEHIKLLKEQAMEWVPNMADPDTKIRLLNAEKFAVLLMREIAMVQISYQTGMDLENKKMDNPAREMNYAVIEHFGVGK